MFFSKFKEPFRVPLHAQHPTVMGTLIGFHEPRIGIGQCDRRKGRRHRCKIQTLVMKGIDSQTRHACNLVKTAPGGNHHIVERGLLLWRAMTIKVLYHGTAGRHIEHLTAATDRKERKIAYQRLPCQLKFQLITTQINAICLSATKLLAKVPGMNIAAPRKNQPIELR